VDVVLTGLGFVTIVHHGGCDTFTLSSEMRDGECSHTSQSTTNILRVSKKKIQANITHKN
jgi:hypothetical protein